METQTQMHRMGLNLFLTFYIDVDAKANANVKCEHTLKLSGSVYTWNTAVTTTVREWRAKFVHWSDIWGGGACFNSVYFGGRKAFFFKPSKQITLFFIRLHFIIFVLNQGLIYTSHFCQRHFKVLALCESDIGENIITRHTLRPFTHAVSMPVSVTVTVCVKVYHCASGDK